LDCLRKTVAAEGVAVLWAGWLPTWLRMMPWSLTFFVTFEQLRRLTGQSSF
jgi:solute carrier family 25 uncoupling protein 27